MNLSGQAPDPVCSVVALNVGAVQSRRVSHGPTARWRLAFLASDAELHGGLQIESKDGKSNIGFWIQSEDWIEWGVRIQQPAKFTVVADVAATGESHLVLQIGDRELKADIPNTGDYAKFQPVELGKPADRPGGSEQCRRAIR